MSVDPKLEEAAEVLGESYDVGTDWVTLGAMAVLAGCTGVLGYFVGQHFERRRWADAEVVLDELASQVEAANEQLDSTRSRLVDAEGCLTKLRESRASEIVAMEEYTYPYSDADLVSDEEEGEAAPDLVATPGVTRRRDDDSVSIIIGDEEIEVSPTREIEEGLHAVVLPDGDEEEAETPTAVTIETIGDHGDVWNWQIEQERRGDGSDPYVLHHAEYAGREYGLTQIQLTFWDVDQVLSDELGEPVDGELATALVGLALEAFGHGSMDPDIVFVRNEALGSEYEIVRREGSYHKEILGES